MKKGPKKVWGPASIRELARKNLQAIEEGQEESASRSPSRGAAKLREIIDKSKSGLDVRRLNQELPHAGDENDDFAWGGLDSALDDRVITVVPADGTDQGEEIQLLCSTLGLETAETIFLSKNKKVDSSNYMGSGTLERLQGQLHAFGCGAVVVDAKLSPSQVRNMEEILKVPVLDREGVILSIFQRHAKTKLAKLQVEIAQLKYLSPRLSGLWMGLSRQRGGRGGLKGRGAGETRLELDRRVLKDRITSLTKKLKDAEKAFNVQSARRANLSRVALVGYTNAGKSTLMRRLTKSDVDVHHELFSTLDTTVRTLVPPTVPKILVSDTVGFVKNLPHDLVASFKSTLAEALNSRLIMIVVDMSHPRWEEQLATTESVLSEIGADAISKILVLNKIDRLPSTNRMNFRLQKHVMGKPEYKDKVFISALTGEGLQELRDTIIKNCGASIPKWAVAAKDVVEE
jgi:GTP-binding protein HflX